LPIPCFRLLATAKRFVFFQLEYTISVFGWLLPLVVVGVSVAAELNGYGSDRGCWLSVNNGLIWAFIGPALGFIGASTSRRFANLICVIQKYFMLSYK